MDKDNIELDPGHEDHLMLYVDKEDRADLEADSDNGRDPNAKKKVSVVTSNILGKQAGETTQQQEAGNPWDTRRREMNRKFRRSAVASTDKQTDPNPNTVGPEKLKVYTEEEKYKHHSRYRFG